ncbi:unnamed protein product [Somion occarium]|uniref:FAD-binding domain-containing protein n=1 Tax=Somion occarium TaxID=3059160 RepID=A0ABP1CIV9_9APHY
MSSLSVNRKKLQVAVIGGGIVGLITAIALTKEGVGVHLYEATEKLAEIGAGIGLAPNAIRILQSLGVLYDVLPTFDQRPPLSKAFAFKYADEGQEMIFDSMEEGDGVGLHRIGVHRAALLDALVKHVDPQITHFGKRLQSITPLPSSNQQIMHFADGTSAEADVIIGADGIKSTVRSLLFAKDESGRVVFTGTVAYRGLITVDDAKAAGVNPAFMTRPTCLIWKGKHLIVDPIHDSDLFNIVAFVTDRSIPFGEIQRSPTEPWVIPVTPEGMLADFADCGANSDTIKLLRCINNPTKWFLYAVYPVLDTYVKGRVALVGDAAHAMLPHLGAGAGQGMEDAYLLAKLLGRSSSNPSAQDVESALKSYDDIRKPRAHSVWEGSQRVGDVYEGYGPTGFSIEGMRQDLLDLRDGLFYRGLEEDLQLKTLA